MLRQTNGRVCIQVKQRELFYIPIIQTLQDMLKNMTVLKEVCMVISTFLVNRPFMQSKHILNVGYLSLQVMVGHQSMNDSVITDFCD